MMGVLIKKENLKTDTNAGKSPCEDEGRDRVRLLPAREWQGLPASHQELGRGMEKVVPQNEPTPLIH